MSAKKASAKGDKVESKVSLYHAWCKRCGNCVAFCPRKVLESDEWGYPYQAQPERCIACGLCEKLCPDFAITVGEPSEGEKQKKKAPSPGTPGSNVSPNHSPERLAPMPADGEENGA